MPGAPGGFGRCESALGVTGRFHGLLVKVGEAVDGSVKGRDVADVEGPVAFPGAAAVGTAQTVPFAVATWHQGLHSVAAAAVAAAAPGEGGWAALVDM
jgi:hypothetical protein